ncbi:MAG TPA: phosphate ABC transporter permease subunit PstC [Mycobacteriales bacterium]|nr:phosphate ABC transporter permease subunit PstC [Mycobacteriales bacterium]HWC34208.1 phosphate ABC transporter permease subunit PstC [Mycobacteriales bacterium]
MTAALLDQPPGGPPAQAEDAPRVLARGLSKVDRVFHASARSVGVFVLVLTGSIGVFLGYQMIPTIHRYGWSFFTENRWVPQLNVFGISSAVVGTIQVAVMALAIAFPLALMTALFITEYAPRRLQSWFISLVDLMSAVPSILFGAWAVAALQPHALFIARWISRWFGWIPIFKVPSAPGGPGAAAFSQHSFALSPFIAAIAVSMMVIPLACSVMRNVFSQAPIGEREAAYALGSTRWGMIRAVVLPFGRRGIIGGTMLGLGRALGETVAVLLIISLDFGLKVRVLENGTVTISSLIANNFGDASPAQLSALLAAGFVLFLMTLAVNTGAAVIISRSRSGEGLDV